MLTRFHFRSHFRISFRLVDGNAPSTFYSDTKWLWEVPSNSLCFLNLVGSWRHECSRPSFLTVLSGGRQIFVLECSFLFDVQLAASSNLGLGVGWSNLCPWITSYNIYGHSIINKCNYYSMTQIEWCDVSLLEAYGGYPCSSDDRDQRWVLVSNLH